MRTAPRIGSGLVGWRRLTVVAALANAVVLFGYGLTRGDREALGFAVVMLVGAGLLRVGSGVLGLLVLAALFVNITFWMFPAANGNATYRVGLADLLVPASLVAFSLAGFIGAVAALVHLRDPALTTIPVTLVCASFPSDQVRQLAAEGVPMFAPLRAYDEVTYVDLPTSHWPMWSRPDDLAAVLHDAATADRAAAPGSDAAAQ